jgi:peptidyl-tRNA hydrolase, PTH1 family
MSEERWLVFGLGNPGDQYSLTRHNIGQIVVDYLADSFSRTFSTHRSRTMIAEIKIGTHPVVLAKSQGYMNESGGPARALADFYKISPNHVITIHDELDLPYSEMRIKFGGGDNGHNGVKSLTQHFRSPDFYRIRMGIGRPAHNPADYVLNPFSQSEVKELEPFVERASHAVDRLIQKGLELAQQEFNK